MKIAVTASGSKPGSMVDNRFGRAAGFIIYNTDTGSYEFSDNVQNREAPQGAGIQSAKTVINSGATVLITGNVGPKAHEALVAGGIEIYHTSGGTVSEAIDDFRSGSLVATDSVTMDGHR